MPSLVQNCFVDTTDVALAHEATYVLLMLMLFMWMMMLIFDVDVYVVYAADGGDVDSNIDIDFV